MKKTQHICIVLLSLMATIVFAEKYSSDDYYYTVNLPTGWVVQDESDATQVFFANEIGDAGVMVGVFDYDPDVDKAALLESIVDKLHMTGDYSTSTFKNYKAVRGNYNFKSDGLKMNADLIIFDTSYYFFMIMGTSLAKTTGKNKAAMAELINSFKYQEEAGDVEDTVPEDTVDNKANKKDKDKLTSATKNNSNSKGGTDEQDYLLDVDWGDYFKQFNFRKSDYYSAVWEGEKIVGSGDVYGYYKIDTNKDDNYGETFWARFYQDMYNKNYQRVEKMTFWFREAAKENSWSAYELAEQVVKCIQVIPYERPYNVVSDKSKAANSLDFFTPNEIAWYNKGDCDTKSLLIVTLLRQLGYDAAIFFSTHYEHAMAGVNVNATGTYLKYQNKKYFFIESTYPGWKIGDLPPDFGEANYWTVMPIK